MSKHYFYNRYYEQDVVWSKELDIQEEKRIQMIIDQIPEDVNSILEVGCGDGRIINRLINQYYRVMGVDISENALKRVKTTSTIASSDKLPFSNGEFDIIICSEVLEHLPREIYGRSLKEIERVASDYIIITIPYNENLNDSRIQCEKCGFTFHICGHLRSYALSDLILFEQFTSIEIGFISVEEPIFPKKLYNLIKRVFDLQYIESSTSICPRCGYQPIESFSLERRKTKFFNFFLDLKKYIPKRNRKKWIIAIYKRE